MVVNHRIMLINHDPFLSPPENHWGFLLKHKKAYVYPSNTNQLSSEASETPCLKKAIEKYRVSEFVINRIEISFDL